MSQTLYEICEVKTHFEDADFWLVRKGSFDKVGKPVRSYSPENIGIKVVRTDLMLPTFLFYFMEFLYTKKYFQELATGALRLQHIRVEDIKDLPLNFRK